MVFLFVTAHRFCCLHSRPPQGRGSVRAAPRRARFGAQPTRSGGTWRGDGPFDGFPHSRSITRPQATDFAQQNRPLQKENTILTDGVSFWSGRRGSTRYRHPTNGRAIRRSPAGPLDSTRFAPVEAASSSLPATFQKENTILTDGVFFLERATRLELATSTLARSRSTR